MQNTRRTSHQKYVVFPIAVAAFLAVLTPAMAHPVNPPTKTTPVKLPDASAPGSPAEAKEILQKAPKAEDFPNASKSMLLDLADITVKPDGSFVTVTRSTTRIFNERGREEEGEVRIPYTAGQETIKFDFIRTIRPDGTVATVKPEQILDQSIYEGNNIYTDARVKIISMPALEAGAIIDYQYTTTSTNPYLPGQFTTQWFFGGMEPRKLSRLTLTVPKSMNIHEVNRNVKTDDWSRTVKPSADGKNVTYTFSMKDIPALELEPMMPELSRTTPQLYLSTLGDWQDIADVYWSLAKDRMAPTEDIKKLAATLTKGKTTQEEKAKAIFYYVEETTRYVSKSLSVGAIQPRHPSETLEDKFGDCKDMTTLLVSLLREAGITANPALLNPLSKAPIREDLPSLNAFIHVVCLAEINDKKYWLDATAMTCPFGQIPGMDRGSDALVIRNGKGTFETIPNYEPEENQTKLNVKIDLKEDGSATGKITMTGNGDANNDLRNTLMFLPPDRVRGYVEKYAQSLGANARLTDYTVSDFRDKDKPVTLEMNVTFPVFAKKSGDLLVFNARPEQVGSGYSTPFGPDTIRRTPITQDSSVLGNSQLEVTLPKGFMVLAKPNPADISSEIGRYKRQVSLSDNVLKIEINAADLRASVPASKYSEIQSYYDNFIKAYEESVVVKKM